MMMKDVRIRAESGILLQLAHRPLSMILKKLSPLARRAKALQGLVHSGAAAKIGESVRRPNLIRVGRESGIEPGIEVDVLRGGRHVRNKQQFSETKRGGAVEKLLNDRLK